MIPRAFSSAFYAATRLLKRNKSLCSNVLIFVALMISSGAWVYASPVGSDPDSNFHLATIWCAGGVQEDICLGESIPVGQMRSHTGVPVGVAQANGCMPGTPGQSANCTNELMAKKEFSWTATYDSYGLYPKGFYWVANKLVSENITNSVLRIRFMNLFLFLLLVCCANVLLPHNLRRGLNIALLVILVPLGFFLIASTNPSSWAVTGNATYWAFLYSFLILGTSLKQKLCGVFAVIAAVVAMVARADSAAFILLTTVVVVSMWIARSKDSWRPLFFRVLLPIIACIPAWLIFRGSEQGQAAFTGFVEGNYGRDHFAITLWNITRLPGVFTGIFGYKSAGGGLGWLDIAMPELVVFSGLILLGIMVSKFLVFKTYFEAIVITGFSLSVCAIPLAILYRDTAIVGENFQSRYILPLVPPLVGLIVSTGDRTRRMSRPIKVLIVLLSISAYSVALHTTMRRYITGDDVMDWNLNRNIEWWWTSAYSPMTIFWAGTVSALVVVLRVVFVNLNDESISLGDDGKDRCLKPDASLTQEC
jgi:hypothetical protein